MSTSLLHVDDLSVSYGGVHAVTGVSLQLDAGSCAALVGANGAGKTSLLKAIGGLQPARRGTTVVLDGRRIQREDAARRAQAGLAHVLEGRHVFPDMTVRENLEIAAVASRRSSGRRQIAAACAEAVSLLPELEPFMNKKAGLLSGGQQQMLAIGRALAGLPRVVMMDEPTNGLAPLLVERVVEIIRSVRARGIAVLLVEQRLEVAQAVGERIHILQRGRIIRETVGSDPGLADLVHAAYLG